MPYNPAQFAEKYQLAVQTAIEGEASGRCDGLRAGVEPAG